VYEDIATGVHKEFTDRSTVCCNKVTSIHMEEYIDSAPEVCKCVEISETNFISRFFIELNNVHMGTICTFMIPSVYLIGCDLM